MDLDVKPEKVTGVYSTNQLLPLNTLKEKAVEEAIKNSNADVLVEPVYKLEKRVETTNYVGDTYTKTMTVMTVTGYPGYIKTFILLKMQKN